MKILHVLAQLPSRTGSGVYFSNIIEGLSKNHTQACVYAFQNEYEFDILNKNMQYSVEFKTDRLPFPIVGMSDVMPYESTLYSEMTNDMIEVWRKEFKDIIKKAVEEFKPDIIICNHLWILTAMVREMYPDINVIGVCHGTDIRQSQKSEKLRKRYVTNIDKLDKVFALSELQVPEIQNEYGISRDKIVVIGGGFNDKIFYEPKDKTKRNKNISIIYAGKIAASKGVFELIEAFEYVYKQNQDVTLSIIGSMDIENKKRIDDLLEYRKNILVYNVKNQKSLADLFRESDIFVLPSYFEGLGLVAIESLACGMRAVTTRIEGLESLLGEEINSSGIIEYVEFPRLKNVDEPFEEDIPQFKQNLSNAILKQVNKVLLGEEVPVRIKDEIAKHSWSQIIESIEVILKSI